MGGTGMKKRFASVILAALMVMQSPYITAGEELLPEARIGIAHGKMAERELEQVIEDFWEKKLV